MYLFRGVAFRTVSSRALKPKSISPFSGKEKASLPSCSRPFFSSVVPFPLQRKNLLMLRSPFLPLMKVSFLSRLSRGTSLGMVCNRGNSLPFFWTSSLPPDCSRSCLPHKYDRSVLLFLFFFETITGSDLPTSFLKLAVFVSASWFRGFSLSRDTSPPLPPGSSASLRSRFPFLSFFEADPPLRRLRLVLFLAKTLARSVPAGGLGLSPLPDTQTPVSFSPPFLLAKGLVPSLFDAASGAGPSPFSASRASRRFRFRPL